MSNRLIDLLLSLSPRERLLIGVVTFFILPLAVVFGLLLPMVETRKQAEQAHIQALALQSWVRDRANQAATLTPAPSQRVGQPLGLAGLEQSLIQANLREDVTALSARGNDGIALTFDQVDFLRFTTWLAGQHPQWGYVLDSYRIEATETASVISVTLILSPR